VKNPGVTSDLRRPPFTGSTVSKRSSISIVWTVRPSIPPPNRLALRSPRPDGAIVPVPYLGSSGDGIGVRIAAFNLKWVPTSEKEVDRALNISDDALIDSSGACTTLKVNLTKTLAAWWYGLGGAKTKVGMTR